MFNHNSMDFKQEAHYYTFLSTEDLTNPVAAIEAITSFFACLPVTPVYRIPYQENGLHQELVGYTSYNGIQIVARYEKSTMDLGFTVGELISDMDIHLLSDRQPVNDLADAIRNILTESSVDTHPSHQESQILSP
jgi:hypothetical protein